VHGDDLKSDLKRLDQYYDGLPEETKAEGVYRFAAYPPDDDSYLVTRLWKKHMKPPEGYVQRTPQYEGKAVHVPPAGSDPKEIIKAVDHIDANAVALEPGIKVAMDEAAFVSSSALSRERKESGQECMGKLQDSLICSLWGYVHTAAFSSNSCLPLRGGKSDRPRQNSLTRFVSDVAGTLQHDIFALSAAKAVPFDAGLS
jgi:hypothetical protein